MHDHQLDCYHPLNIIYISQKLKLFEFDGNQNGCLIIKIDDNDFAILETNKSVINDDPFYIYDIDVELNNIRHLLSVNDFDELDDLWDN